MLEKFFEANRDRWSENTELAYRRFVTIALRACGQEPSCETLRSWLDGQRSWSLATRALAIRALRAYFAWSVGEANSPAHKLRLPKIHARPQRTLKAEELERLLAACDTSTAIGMRDAAMIGLMADSGLRVSEACGLRLGDLDLAERSLHVQVKGGAWGSGVFGDYTAHLLRTWLEVRPTVPADAVFVSFSGKTPGSAMTRHGFASNLKTLAKRAGLKPLSPHALRRTFATLALQSGAPTRLVQVAGRWKTLAMVERYSSALTAADFAPYSPVSLLFAVPKQSA
jgi:integrase/recombinase XerD